MIDFGASGVGLAITAMNGHLQIETPQEKANRHASDATERAMSLQPEKPRYKWSWKRNKAVRVWVIYFMSLERKLENQSLFSLK